MDLLIAYRNAKYQIAGHGPREIRALQDAIDFANERYQQADIYGTGQVIADFEGMIAEHCGKEAAIFFPSGTMAQQIALRIWCDKNGSRQVAYHPLCHLEIHEEDGFESTPWDPADLIGRGGPSLYSGGSKVCCRTIFSIVD